MTTSSQADASAHRAQAASVDGVLSGSELSSLSKLLDLAPSDVEVLFSQLPSGGLAQRHTSAEVLLAKKRRPARALRSYYGPVDSGLSSFDAIVGDQQIETTIYTTAERVGMVEPTKDIDTELVEACGGLIAHPDPRYALQTLKDLRCGGGRVWNAPLYRLQAATFEGPLRLSFSVSDYFSTRFSTGLVEDELLDSLSRSDRTSDGTAELRIRDRLLGRGTLLNFEDRLCPGGVVGLCAFARSKENDFCIPIGARSSHVARGRGLLSVVPLGFHQSSVIDAEHAQIYWSLLRELYEELLRGKDVPPASEHVSCDWFCDEHPAMRALRNGEFGSTVDCTGFGIDLLDGAYIAANLVTVPDARYWDEFGVATQSTWEYNSLQTVSSKDADGIARLLTQSSWANTALFCFVEGLLALAVRYPERVRLPPLRRSLGETLTDTCR
jgi:hypothetical protein